MEFLKDKKNLPIVVAMLVFVVLAAGGFVAYNSGLFTQTASAPTSTVPNTVPPTAVANGRPLEPGVTPVISQGRPIRGIVPEAVAIPKKPVAVNPLVGPDPFKIPGAAKKVADDRHALAGLILPLRDRIGPLNLFQIRPPAAASPPDLPDTNPQTGLNPASNYRLSGVITGTDGINAILEVGGQSQSVKPGDSLPDGTQVQNIQTTSITLRTAGGSVINLPLSAGTPDQGTFNGPPQFQPGFNPGFNGRPQFNPQGQ